MLAEIENAVIARLAEKLPEIKAVETGKGKAVLAAKAAYTLAIMKGEVEEVTQPSADKQHVDLYIWVTFKNVKSDQDRRHGAFPAIEGLAQILMNQRLGLEIRKLKYKGFSEASTPEDIAANQAVYQLEFKTSYGIKMLEEEAAQDLVAIGLKYLMGGVEQAADVVTLKTE